ncbi:MAG: proteasome assembly chaperone family protein [Candidatus Altiarchaeota archaeon]
MNDITMNVTEKPKLKDAILIEGLPGIGLVGKLAADHLLDEVDAKKMAELYSHNLPPQVMIQDDGTVKLVNMEFYYHKTKKNHLVFLVGDFQGITPESQYRLTDEIIAYAKKIGVRRVYTLGGLGTGNLTKTPRVFGAATNHDLVKEHEKYDIIFKGGGAILGASGLLLGIGMQHGIEGVCLMGETHGQIIDAKSAEAVLEVLTKILNLKIDNRALVEKAKDTEEQMMKISQMISANQQAQEQQKKFLSESPSYIR